MNKVRILPPEIVSKIAAGEVVERPASVLKELMENSIDAGCTSLEVILENAGKTLIKIKDNGRGISEEDINTIFNRHATSKISSIDELYSISSLGFRGEALYSISAVSDITLRSKTKDQDCGWEVHLRGTTKLAQKPATIQTGTEIEVKELFFNTPARKKFLKSNSTEINALIDVFLPYCLLYPQNRFSLTHEKRKLLDLPPAKDITERISLALSLDLKDLLEKTRDFPEDNLSLQMVLGDINIQRARKDMQYIFINRRPIQSKTISYHLNDIYRQLLSPGVYPFFCIFITMPAQDLDVNVHPTKREVKIKDESILIAALRRTAEHLLMSRSKARQAQSRVFTLQEPSPAEYKPHPSNASFSYDKPSQTGKRNELSLEENILLFKTEGIFAQNSADLKAKLQQSRYLGNLLKKYLLFESPDSLLIIDQHAAAERINFEKFKKQIESGKIEVQQLLSPILIKLTPQELLLWEENKDTLEKTGFNCTLFDKHTLALHAYPQLIDQPENSVRNLLAGEKISRLDPETLARMACRSSVMAGEAVSKDAAEYLRKELLSCSSPFTCPHGRPTVIEISDSNLNKQFLRT